jgi:predicted TIM-barrel fold metal-dependent hydrolase
VIALAVQADDEHGTSVAIAAWLVGREDRFISSLGSDVADAFAKAAVTELVRAAKELDGIVGVVGSERRLHGAVVLITKRKNVRPHAQ